MPETPGLIFNRQIKYGSDAFANAHKKSPVEKQPGINLSVKPTTSSKWRDALPKCISKSGSPVACSRTHYHTRCKAQCFSYLAK